MIQYNAHVDDNSVTLNADRKVCSAHLVNNECAKSARIIYYVNYLLKIWIMKAVICVTDANKIRIKKNQILRIK